MRSLSTIENCTFNAPLTLSIQGIHPDPKFYRRIIPALQFLFQRKSMARPVYVRNCVFTTDDPMAFTIEYK